jgi:hypothetical protein
LAHWGIKNDSGMLTNPHTQSLSKFGICNCNSKVNVPPKLVSTETEIFFLKVSEIQKKKFKIKKKFKSEFEFEIEN